MSPGQSVWSAAIQTSVGDGHDDNAAAVAAAAAGLAPVNAMGDGADSWYSAASDCTRKRVRASQ